MGGRTATRLLAGKNRAEIDRLTSIVRDLRRTAVQLEAQMNRDASKRASSPFGRAASRNIADLKKAISHHLAQIRALREPAI